MTEEELRRVGGIIRAIDDNSLRLTPDDVACWKVLLPATSPELIWHSDLVPWNLLVGELRVFIDWDRAAPAHGSTPASAFAPWLMDTTQMTSCAELGGSNRVRLTAHRHMA